MSRKETMEQFGSCWEGLEYPRSCNATLHDFHELQGVVAIDGKVLRRAGWNDAFLYRLLELF